MVIKSVEQKMSALEVSGGRSSGVREDSSENYVYLEKESKGMGSEIPIVASQAWQEEIMKDPKVGNLYIPTKMRPYRVKMSS